MPIHDWSRVEHGLFHHFHQAWMLSLSSALNHGGLPPGFFALVEQVISGPLPDVITLQRPVVPPPASGGIAVTTAPPKARFVRSAESDVYARKASRIAIRHQAGQMVAIVEILSPGNKGSQSAIRAFVEKAASLLRSGISLLIVDVFPPSIRDPQGIHKAIWAEFEDDPFELPPEKPLTVAAYSAADPVTYVEPVAVGDSLPGLPIFLSQFEYVPAPLETSYQRALGDYPEHLRAGLTGGQFKS